MLADLQVIGDDGIPHPFEPVLLLRLHSVLVVRHGAFRNRIGEDTLFLLGIVDTRSGADIQPLDGVDIDISVTEHAPVGIAVILVALQTGNGVLAVWVTAYWACKLTLRSVYRQRGVELQHVLQEPAGSRDLGGAVHRKVLANRHIVLENLIVAIDTRRETVKIRSLDDTVVLIVA